VDRDGGFLVDSESPNAEWRAQSVVEDVVGALVCLDCQPELTEDGKLKVKKIR